MDTTAKLWSVERGVELHTLAVSQLPLSEGPDYRGWGGGGAHFTSGGGNNILYCGHLKGLVLIFEVSTFQRFNWYALGPWEYYGLRIESPLREAPL